ncbi:MAG: hypothetical protein BroJett024_15590 [Alphaproteobacteria bacterium]|nr:MAG: hypothetical protein BroJett024_15590 [Alphaproteobacteria bacterium]
MRETGRIPSLGLMLVAGAAMLCWSAADVAAQSYRPGFSTSVGPRISGPSIGAIGPRGPNFNTGPTRTPDWGKGTTKPKHPETGGRRPPRRPGGPAIVVIPPGGFGPPPIDLPPGAPPPGARGPSGASGPLRAVTGVPPAGERRYVPDEVIIEVAGSPPQQAADALARRFRLARIESLNLPATDTTIFRWRIPDRRSVPAVIRQLEADRFIRAAQPNYLYTLSQAQTASAPPDAPLGDPAQYALGKLRLAQAHGIAQGERVLVAVIDSGVDAGHPELAGVVADTFDTLDPKEPPHAHGTAIAGTIAAHSRLRGVAPAARLLTVRAFGESKGGAEGTTFNILKGVDWALGKGARVINMSFAGPADPALSRALATARGKGAILIAAAGNAGPKSPPLYPAADPNVIAVTATDAQDNLFPASNRGAHVEIAAPGVDILVPSTGGSYQVSSGTSLAAAHVSGVAALLVERRHDLTGDQVRRILAQSAKDLGPKGKDMYFGAGLADAFQALMAPEIAGTPHNTSASAR